MRLLAVLDLTTTIVDVSYDVVAYLLFEAHLDGPLVGRPSILEFEGHGGIAVRTERRYE